MKKYSIIQTVLVAVVIFLNSPGAALAADYEPKPDDPYFLKFNPRKAPAPGPLLLNEGDRLAIIGDSITEQKIYSRIIETYLTVCVPELKITARQFGWGGETAEGFLHRMTNDCLRFQPTVATLCYGMNDFHYRPFDMNNAEWYRDQYSHVVLNLENAGARVVLGSPGCVGKVSTWTHFDAFTLDELNISLCAFRDIDIQIAQDDSARFADIFWTMFKAGHEGQNRYGTANESYQISGKDGVHPGWAGHLVMAYTFLRAMGLDGDIGTLTVDLGAQTATATAGHTVESFKDGALTVVSTKYPFCVSGEFSLAPDIAAWGGAFGPKASGEINSANSVRSGATLVPFFDELNRFRLVVTNASAPKYQIIWGSATNIYTAEQLASGVNLAAGFLNNPFCDAFNKVDAAVAAQQEFETRQIKQIFHGDEGRTNMEKAVADTEVEHARLAKAIADAMTPVRHTILIQPAQ